MRRCLAPLAALMLALVLTGAANAGVTIAFYAHGWGVGEGLVYFPHAFVLISRQTAPGAPVSQETFGYTAVSQHVDVLMHPTPGEVIPANPAYVKRARLHFALQITEAQYQAVKATVAAWAAPSSPLYNLDGHNCITFVAALANVLGLKTPPPTGRDPDRFLEAVRRMNPDLLVPTAAAALPAPGG